MADDISVGSVSVDIVPDASKFPPRLAAAVLPAARKIGEQFGEQFGRAARDRIARGVREGINEGAAGAGRQGARQGEDFGGSFARALKARLEAAFRSIPDVEINADSSGADREIAAIREQLAALRDKRIGIDIDGAQAVAEVERLNERLRELAANSPDIELRVNVGQASAELQAFQAEVNRLDGQSPTIRPDVDTAAASARLGLLGSQASGAGGRLFFLAAAATFLSVALIPIGAAAIGAMAAITTGAIVAAGAVGVLALALAPVIGAIMAVRAANDQAASSSRGATAAGLQMASAMDAVAAAHRGVKSAVDEARAAQVRSNEAIRQAERGVADAERRAAQARIDQARRVADAKQALADAIRDAAADQVSASRRVADAERGLADAQRNALDAQEDLSRAREDAARDAEDLASRVAGGVLDERDAVLRVQEAQERLAEVMSDPGASDLQRERARLAVDEAIQGLADQRRENTRLAQEKAESDAAGIEGSRGVQDALERLTEAQRRAADAQRSVADATAAAAEQQQRSARDVADAERDVADAVADSKERQRADTEAIADAHRKLATSVADAATQQKRSAEQVADAQRAVVAAQRGVQQASQSAGAAGGAAFETMNLKLAALTPAGRDFVAFITGQFIPAFKGLSGVAQTGLLPGLQDGLAALLPLMPRLRGFVGGLAKTMGDLFREAGQALTAPFWTDFFAFIGRVAGPMLRGMAEGFGNIITGFAGLLQAFAPTTKQFGTGLLGLTERFAEFGKTAGDNKGFQNFIQYILTNGPKVASTFGAIFGALGDFIRALAPVGPIALGIVKAFSQIISALPQSVLIGLAAGFVAVAVGIGLTNIALGVFAANPAILIVAGIIIALVALGVAIYELYQRSDLFREIVQTSWAAIQEAIRFAWESVIQPVFRAIADFVTGTLIPAFQVHLLPILRAVWSGIQVAISVAWGVIRVILGAIVSYVRNVVAPVWTWLWHNVVQPVWTGIRIAISVAWALIKIIFGLIVIYVREVLAPIFTRFYNDIIKPVWGGISTTISAAWNNVIKPVFQALGSFISDKVAPPFTRGVEALGKAWDKFRDAAKVPVRFLVETILNKGIIGSFNKLAGYFGVDKVSPIELPEGFATGGYVSGPGGPRDDLIPAMLSNGEFVINAAATKRNLALIKAINAGLDLGGDPSGVARFAKGGLIEDTKKWLPSVDPLPYVWGGVGPNGFDCSGLAGEVFARVQDLARNTRYFTTSSNFADSGFAPGPGLFSIGVDPGSHMAGNLAGLGFEARSTATGIFVGNSAKSPASFPRQFHLAALPGGKAPDGISITNPIGSARDFFAGILDGYAGFANNPFGSILTAVPGRLVDGAMDTIKGALPGFAGGGLVTKYDDGGYLPPGLSTVLNATGRPEPVFTADQFRKMGSQEPTELVGSLFLDSGEYLGSVKGTVRSVLKEGQSTTANMRSAAMFGPGART